MKNQAPPGHKKSLSRMGRSLSGAGGSFQKSLSRMNRRRSARRHAAEQGQAERDILRERKAQAIAKRRHRARKAVEERREAFLRFLRTGFRIETLRGALQSPFVRRWAPRAVGVIAVVSLIGNVLQYSRYSPWRPW